MCFPPVLTSPSSSKVWRLLQGRWQCWLTELWTPFRWTHTFQSWLYIFTTSTAAVLTPSDCVFRIAMDLTERTAFEWNGSCITGRTSLLIGSGLSFLHEHTSEREGARERDQDPGAPNLSPDHCRHSCWQYFNFFLRTHFIFRSTGKSVKFVFRIAVLSVWTNSPVFYAMYWSLISNRYGFEKYSVWN